MLQNRSSYPPQQSAIAPSQASSSEKSIPTSLTPSAIRGSITTPRKVTIYDRNLNRRAPELSLASFAFLFSELVQYSQKNVKGIQEMETKLSDYGYHVGQRVLELTVIREIKNAKRETRVLGLLQFINTGIWKSVFGKPADALEKSKDQEDEYMIIDNDPIVNKYISVPKEMSQLNCAAFQAGIVEAVMDGCQFPARVTAHSVPTDLFPLKTVFLVKLDPVVVERERYMR
ncbi:NO signaling/Golgi transport ligand-binding domain-containing protein [Lipomyces orientalis]|uniref:NO signaling/Golgi transport ligand-binding domain-containing protein n=1 Tax=Lipomyces orientalis TaxID=1233043 RepID=A0ACC3TJE4_9ASCO